MDSTTSPPSLARFSYSSSQNDENHGVVEGLAGDKGAFEVGGQHR